MRQRFPLLLALLATALAYISTLRFPFVYDDEPFILSNPELQSWSFVPHYFHEHVWQFKPWSVPLYYRPFFVLVMRCCYALFGIRPLGWHAVTLGLHLLATFLVYRIAQRLIASDTAALIAALVFGLHPVHAESVAWIDGLTDPLATTLLLAAFLIYLRNRQTPHVLSVLCFSVLFAAALLSKEPALLFLPVMAVYALLQPITPRRNEIPWFASLLVLTVAYFPVRHAALGILTERRHSLHGFKFVLFTEPSLVWFYIRHLLFPFHLAIAYEFPIVRSFTAREVLLPLVPLLVIAAVLTLALRRLKRKSPAHFPIAIFAVAWFFLFIALSLDLMLTFVDDHVHDRYLYLPSVGFALLMGILLAPLFDTPRLTAMPRRTIAVTAAVILAFACHVEVAPWHSDETLFRRALESAPNNTAMQASLGVWLVDHDQLPEGIALLQLSVGWNPRQIGALEKLATAYERQGALRRARDTWASAARFHSDEYIQSNLDRLNQLLASQP